MVVKSDHRSHSPYKDLFNSGFHSNLTNSTAGQSTNHNEKVRLLLRDSLNIPAAVYFIFERRSIHGDKKYSFVFVSR